MKILIALLLILQASASFANSQAEVYIDSAKFVLRDALVLKIVSKEVCSCYFVQHQPKDRCIKTAGMPVILARMAAVTIKEENGQGIVIATRRRPVHNLIDGNPLDAPTHFQSTIDLSQPQFGCRLDLEAQIPVEDAP